MISKSDEQQGKQDGCAMLKKAKQLSDQAHILGIRNLKKENAITGLERHISKTQNIGISRVSYF